ncbi:magnesium transporter NIPA-domain-containing protein [Mycena pura]|uniref:Magnesium transporter NIPA-domain-containing protein n=1 Tax=Mycena pura TaxID=153505 RepID=A0AAD7E5J6_9AGAR|nr:magnesium transporter NIPA-domain-containing protein [Mycena pura]
MAASFAAQPLAACYPDLTESAALPLYRIFDISSKLPELNTGTVIGITIAISGNVLISLALNLQKLAHKRMEAERLQDEGTSSGTLDPNGNDVSQAGDNLPENAQPADAVVLVRQRSDYGSTSRSRPSTKETLLSRLFRSRQARVADEIASERTALLPVDVIMEEDRRPNREPENKALEDGNESDYLKSKLWWLGFALMNVGELGNFISYAWAPASVVAPLGTFALMANCAFAPVMLGERFRKSDILGIFIAVIGAVTIVLASNASDVKLDPDALLAAISQVPFMVYSAVYVAGIFILSILSEGEAGRQWVFVDVGLCALFGGFTVLSTKAVSTLLTMEWFEMFAKWITYPTIAVLALTGVGQIRYLNRALMRFDGKVVIPIQFVLFTMSAIIGSAILYGDFKKATFHQLVTFLYGCAATFTGVFIIAWEPQQEPPREESVSPTDAASSTGAAESDDEGPSKTKRPTLTLPIGFREQHQLLQRPSSISILALSPARPLLMVQTPPREVPERLRERDLERDPQTPSGRRRAISYMGDEIRPHSATRKSINSGGHMGRFSLSNVGISPWNLNDSETTPSSPEDSR